MKKKKKYMYRKYNVVCELLSKIQYVKKKVFLKKHFIIIF